MTSRAQPAARPRTRPTAKAAVLAIVITALAFSAAYPLRQLLDERARIADLELQAQTLQRSNEQLQEELGRLKDPEYLERLARECLGMVKPGEIGFVIVPEDGGRRAPTAC